MLIETGKRRKKNKGQPEAGDGRPGKEEGKKEKQGQLESGGRKPEKKDMAMKIHCCLYARIESTRV